MTRIAVLPPKGRADTLEKLVILAGLRKLEAQVKEEIEEMAISVDVMENDFLRDIFGKGRQEESASMLSRQLQRRFGDIPIWASGKIAKADLSTLEEWSLRFVDAQSLEDVFGS